MNPFLKGWAGAGAGCPSVLAIPLWKGVAERLVREGLWESLKAVPPLPPPEPQQRGVWVSGAPVFKPKMKERNEKVLR